MLEQSGKRVLILAPHTDDGEIGCGGTISKLLHNGCKIYYAAFSICEQSVPEGFPENVLETEVKAATKVLGIPSDNLFVFKYKVRYFSQYRQDILDDMIEIRNKIHPDIVFLPCQNDIHQDHGVISAEGLRAFKNSSLLCYEMPWNNLSFSPAFFTTLEQCHINDKLRALEEYKTQQGIRPYMSRDFIESLATVRGVQAGCEYAEAFEVLKWIL